MRSESDSINEKDQGRRPESKVADVEGSWVLFNIPSEEDSAKELTRDLFGDVLYKIECLFNKDKRSFKKIIEGKRHGT
jgi:hypothetical protein